MKCYVWSMALYGAETWTCTSLDSLCCDIIKKEASSCLISLSCDIIKNTVGTYLNSQNSDIIKKIADTCLNSLRCYIFKKDKRCMSEFALLKYY